MVTDGLEPSTLALLARCSDQLSYATSWNPCFTTCYKVKITSILGEKYNQKVGTDGIEPTTFAV